MAEVDVRVWTRASPEEAFRFLTQFNELPRWVANVQSAEQTTPGPVGKGTRFTQRAALLGRELMVESEVTEYEENRLLTATILRGPVGGAMRWELTPERGGTRIDNRLEITFSGMLAMLASLAEGEARRSHIRNVETLARVLDERAR